MRCLLRLGNSIRSGGALDADGLVEFRRESAEALAGFKSRIVHYMAETDSRADMVGDEDDWYEVCRRRSAIQSLVDDYAGTAVTPWINEEVLADIDEDMRSAGLKGGPLPKERIPVAMPKSRVSLSSDFTRTSVPGTRFLALASSTSSLENTQGAPARARRPSRGFSLRTG